MYMHGKIHWCVNLTSAFRIHGAKISDENKRPNFLIVIQAAHFFFKRLRNLKICIKNNYYEN